MTELTQQHLNTQTGEQPNAQSTTQMSAEQANSLPQQAEESTIIEFDSSVVSGFATAKQHDDYSEIKTQVNVVMDCGASNNRALPIGAGGRIDLTEISSIESRYAIVPVDEKFDMHKITDASIEENGEFIIVERPDSPYRAESYFHNPIKVLKGALIERANKSPIFIDNQFDKTKDIGLFINTLTSLAVIGLTKKSSNLNVQISLSVPPKERYMDTADLQKFKEKLAGTYEVTMPRFNYTATLYIEPKDINVEAEGELAYIFHVSLGAGASERLKDLQDEIVVVHDFGKSTFNLSAVRNKKLIGPSHTVKTGGDNLTSRLYLILSRSLKNPITLAQAQRAVETGYVKDGVGFIPVGKELTQAKEQIAELLYKEYVTYMQILGINFNQVHTILYVGRGMGTTGDIVEGVPTDNYSPSISHILTSMYTERSPHTKYVLVKNAGLANLLGNASLMRNEWFQ